MRIGSASQGRLGGDTGLFSDMQFGLAIDAVAGGVNITFLPQVTSTS